MADGLTRIIKKTPNLTDYFNQLLYGVFHGRSGVNNVYQWFVDGPDRFIGDGHWIATQGDSMVFSEFGDVGIKVGATIPTWMQDKVDQTVKGRVFWLDEMTRPLYMTCIARFVLGNMKTIGRQVTAAKKLTPTAKTIPRATQSAVPIIISMVRPPQASCLVALGSERFALHSREIIGLPVTLRIYS